MKKIIFLFIVFFFYSCFPEPSVIHNKYAPSVAAKKNLELAKEALDEEYYEEAYKYLNFIKANYPYELEIIERVNLMYGDIYFDQGKYENAIDMYRIFIKRYPSSPNLPYAQFQIANSYYKQIPSDYFFLPPPYERDKIAIVYAEKSLGFFILKYPKDKRVPKAQKMLSEVVDYIANYDFYVGEFYYDKEKYQGAIWRFESMMSKYPKSSYYQKALCKTIKSYNYMNGEIKDKKKKEEINQKIKDYRKNLKISCEL